MIKITERVYADFHHPGGNVGCVLTEHGPVLIDTPMLPEEARTLTDELLRLSGRDVACVIYSHQHFDHIMGNGYFKKPAIAHQASLSGINFLKTNLDREIRLIYPDLDEARQKELGGVEVVLPQITFSDRLTLYPGDAELQLSFAGGHSSASIVVYSPRDRVLFAGDNVATGKLPITRNCRFHSWITLLRRLEGMEIDVIVPGHGDLCGPEVLRPVRVYFETMRDRVQALLDSGAPREQAVAEVDLSDCIPPVTAGEDTTAHVAFDIGRMYDQLAKGLR